VSKLCCVLQEGTQFRMTIWINLGRFGTWKVKSLYRAVSSE